MTVNIHYAKTHLSALVKRVREGEVITIGNAGTPVARLVPIEYGAARTPGGFAFHTSCSTPMRSSGGSTTTRGSRAEPAK